MNFEKILKLFSEPSVWRSTVTEMPKHSGWYQIMAVHNNFYYFQFSFYESSTGRFISDEFNPIRLDSNVEVICWRECRRSRFLNFRKGF